MLDEEFFENLRGVESAGGFISPVEDHNGLLVKRDDLFTIHGVSGGKARSAYSLISSTDKPGIVTAGARQSPQVGIVSSIAQGVGKPCVVWSNRGSITPELQFAIDNGAELKQTNTQYNNHIVSSARREAEERDWLDVPFGMECWEAVYQNALQVENLVGLDFDRLVMPVGSAMSFSGVLWGLRYFGIDVPVVGVQVGAVPDKRLAKYAPFGWETQATLVQSELPYHEYVEENVLSTGLMVDPIYEAKVFPYLQQGDLLWVVGIRAGLEQPEFSEKRVA